MQRSLSRLLFFCLAGGFLLLASCGDDAHPPADLGEVQVSVVVGGPGIAAIDVRGYTGAGFGTEVFNQTFTGSTVTNAPLGTFAVGTVFGIVATALDGNNGRHGSASDEFVVVAGVNSRNITIAIGDNPVTVDGGVIATVNTNTACLIDSISIQAPRTIPCATGAPPSNITISITTQNADNAVAGCNTFAYGAQAGPGGDAFTGDYTFIYDPDALDGNGDNLADRIVVQLFALDPESFGAPAQFGWMSDIGIDCINGFGRIDPPTSNFVSMYVTGPTNIGTGYYSEDGSIAFFGQLDANGIPNTFTAIPASTFPGSDLAGASNVANDRWEINVIDSQTGNPARVLVDFGVVP